MKTKKIFNVILGLLLMAVTSVFFAGTIDVSPGFVFAGLLAFSLVYRTPKGVLLMAFTSLTWADGEKNMGGLQTIGYYAPIADIDNFPALPANPATAAEEVTLSGHFSLLPTKYFLKIYSTQETGELVDENQGEKDGQSFKHKATIIFPGTKAEALAFAARVNNSNMVFILVESTGQMRVIGSPAFPAKCKPSFTTGKATGDRKGMTLEIESYGYTPAPIYDGVIRLSGESIS
jgi:hypothetical protein